MHFAKSAVVVVHLMTTLCAITLSEWTPFTCPNTPQIQFKDISEMYNCTPVFVPEEEALVCNGTHPTDPDQRRINFTFKFLQEVPMYSGLQEVPMYLGLQEDPMFLGLLNINASIRVQEIDDIVSPVMSYRADFDPLMAVGILMANYNPSKTNRPYSICLRLDVLKLPMLTDIDVSNSSFWNFSSPLFGTQMNWFLGLNVKDVRGFITPFWLEGLQHTSIESLTVVGLEKGENQTALFKEMPFLRWLILDGLYLSEFHPDSFRGMRELEVLIILRSLVPGIPQMIDRMPELQILQIEGDVITELDFKIPTKELSTLKNLELLNVNYNNIYNISGRIPPLPRLRMLNLCGCRLSSFEESDFEGFPELKGLTLSMNRLTHLNEFAFRPLKQLVYLDLSYNRFTNWPVLHNFSFEFLGISHNLLTVVYNLGKANTTVKSLDISNNRIFNWDNKYIFSLQQSLIPNDEQRNILNRTNSGHTNKNIILTSGSTKTNPFFKILGLSTTQKAELTIPLHSESQRKIFRRIREKLSLVNFYDQTELSKRDNGEEIIVKHFENTVEYSSVWVTKINISNNKISDLSETMMQSLEGIHEVDLGGNEFDCSDCTRIPFQKWLNTTSTNVTNLGTSDPLLCSSPANQRGTPVNLVQYDEEPCLEKIRTTSLLLLIGVPVGVMSMLVVAAAGVIYKYRSAIGYMLHLYKIRQKAESLSRSDSKKYAFDAFICYSSEDRHFILTKLAPLLEKSQERYSVCLYERDFPLGSYILSNIEASIQYSRKTIVVLSEHFMKSNWCKWELEMANNHTFDEDEQFLILIQLEALDRNKLPRHLQFLMDTRTYLEWFQPGHNDEELIIERLKKALGPSLFQTTDERAPLLAEVMEDY